MVRGGDTKSITVLGFNRPDYLRQVLEALSRCRGIDGYRVVVSVDDAENQAPTVQVARDCALHLPDCEVMKQPKRHGVDWHNAAAYDYAFFELGSEFNLAVEDDVTLAEDALELCDWFNELPTRDEYACLLLHSHSRGQWSPLDLEEVFRFNAWGFAMTRTTWEGIFKPKWNCKEHVPLGWDWAAEFVIQTMGLKCLKAFLARSFNIGRDLGTHEYPSHFDEWTKGLEMSAGTYGKDYRINSRLAPGYEKDLSDWVVAELEGRDFK